MPSHRLIAPLCLVLSVVPAIVSRAQDNAPSSDDQPIVLSEFTVHTDASKSYIASESVTGSRVATQIKDLPFTVNVITSEFMNDFDFFDISSDMAYTSSLNGLDTQGNYNLRGFGATFFLRNGFYRLGLVDRVNVDRIEVIKGPNAAIYGQTSPSGLINIITKQPKVKPSQRLSVTAGSDDLVRAEVNVNSPVGTLLGAPVYQLFSGSAMNRNYPSPFAHLRQRLASEALLFKLNGHSSLLAEGEWSKRKSTPTNAQVPFLYNTATKTYSSTYVPSLGNFNQDGPDSVQNREISTVNLTYENRLNSVWSTRAAAYGYARHATNFNSAVGDKYDPATGRFASRGKVVWDTLNEDGGAFQADLLAHYWLGHHAIENKTLATLDFSQNWRYRIVREPNGSQFTINDVAVANPDYSLPPHEAFAIVSRRDKVRWDVQGLFLRQQSAFMENRLIAFAGVRYDRVTYNFLFGDQFNTSGKSVGTVKTPARVDHYTDDAWSPSLGLNFKLTRQLALYANRSESFLPNAQVAKSADPRLPNETAAGWDYGVKGTFLQERLIFTLGGYYIDREGVKAKVTNTGSIDDTQAAGEQVAKGVEFDGSWRVGENLTVLASYGYVNARVVKNGLNVASIGKRPARLPLDNGSLALKYNFGGPLTGFAWTLGVRYTGIAYPNAGSGDASDVRLPSYTTVDTGLTYTWKQQAAKLQHSIRLSAKNLADRDYVTPSMTLGESRGVYVAYTLNH
jgi:iron complex outermembrane receptor protein